VPSDQEFGYTLHDAVSDKVSLVLVYVDPSEAKVRCLSAAHAEKWNKTRADLMAAAQKNMSQILRQTKIETTFAGDLQLGMLSTDFISFKAVLLFCANLKEMVEPVLGWPIFAVMPCSDFVYLLNKKDQPALGRIGPVIMQEYEQSGYPISKEVFENTDEGVRPFGDDQPPLD
jgi:hypothetical protein